MQKRLHLRLLPARAMRAVSKTQICRVLPCSCVVENQLCSAVRCRITPAQNAHAVLFAETPVTRQFADSRSAPLPTGHGVRQPSFSRSFRGGFSCSGACNSWCRSCGCLRRERRGEREYGGGRDWRGGRDRRHRHDSRGRSGGRDDSGSRMRRGECSGRSGG